MPDSAQASSSSLIEMRLTTVRYGAEGTNIFELTPLSGEKVPEFAPGAHIDVHLPNGLIRQYSLLNAPDQRDRYILGIKRDVASRGGSTFIHDKLRVGTLLKIGGPRNHFPMVEDGSPVVLIAGGIGVTPIWAMLQRALEIGIDWRLHYAARTRDEAALLPEILTLAGSVAMHFDDEAGGKPINLATLVGEAPANAHLYCCGPGPMLDAFEACCAAAGISADHVHVERFSAPAPVLNTEGFVVELARSGIELVVEPGQTILDRAREAGVAVDASCEQGICGACETRVLEGIPEHHDMILSETERASNKTIMICCSGSRTERIKLDL